MTVYGILPNQMVMEIAAELILMTDLERFLMDHVVNINDLVYVRNQFEKQSIFLMLILPKIIPDNEFFTNCFLKNLLSANN